MQSEYQFGSALPTIKSPSTMPLFPPFCPLCKPCRAGSASVGETDRKPLVLRIIPRPNNNVVKDTLEKSQFMAMHCIIWVIYALLVTR
jgi:hypothetical protein